MSDRDVVDLFAGPGGWDTGLRLLAPDLRPLGVEWDPDACATAEAAGHLRIGSTVADARGKRTREGGDVAALDPLVVAPDGAVGVIASPPCEGFTFAGKGNGRKDTDAILAAVERLASGESPDVVLAELRAVCQDDRSALVLEPLRWVLDLEPEWTCWEQVPPVLPLWEACAEVLRADGYNVWTGNVQAEQYGVPSTRKRAVLIASRSREVGRPAPTHSRYFPRSTERLDESVLPWVSMAAALGDDAPAAGAMRSNYGTGGDPAARGMRRLDQPAPAITSKIGRNKWVIGTRESDHRVVGAVSLPQAGVLQTFPRDYPWQGARTAQDRQVGDAVPPLLAMHVLAEVTGLPLPD